MRKCRENLSYIPLKTATQPVEHLTGVAGLNPAGDVIFFAFFQKYSPV